MFAVIYQAYIYPKREIEYQEAWHKVADYFVKSRGSIGSCLHRGEGGLWIAYSRWPDKATRDASWPGHNTPSSEMPEDIKKAITTIQECIVHDRKIPEICVDVIDDLLLNNAVKEGAGSIKKLRAHL